MNKPDANVIAAMNACAAHAQNLLDSAIAVQALGNHNIAYHLAALSLEELGRRRLIAMQSMIERGDDKGAWQKKALQDHVKKLFWCFYGYADISDAVDQAKFFELSQLATSIHANRLAGLYVDDGDDTLRIPSQAISCKQSGDLIDYAKLILERVVREIPRDHIPQEEIELQSWFLSAFDDPERRKRLLMPEAFAKLKEMGDATAWTRQMKSDIEREEADLRAIAEAELRRGYDPSRNGTKDKWKIQCRVETHAHSLRPSPLKLWNNHVSWIKLSVAQGAKTKTELVVDLILGDEVPLTGVWDFGFSLAKLLIVALNLATSGFWWWVLPRHKSRYYEKIADLENKALLQLDRTDFRFFDDRRPPLTDAHVSWLVNCFAALPTPKETERHAAYHYYLGGLMFLSLSDIHWRCEDQAFGNFVQALKLIMAEANYQHPAETLNKAAGRLLKEKYPALDEQEHQALGSVLN